MKVRTNSNVGTWQRSIAIEYDSSNKAECEQADKFISRVLPPNSSGSTENAGEVQGEVE